MPFRKADKNDQSHIHKNSPDGHMAEPELFRLKRQPKYLVQKIGHPLSRFGPGFLLYAAFGEFALRLICGIGPAVRT
jgi:hypothetical protein